MKLAIDRRYPSGFAFREFLEDHVHAALVCARRLGWETHSEPLSSADVTLAFGTHLEVQGHSAPREIVVNTERLAGFVHGDREVYVGRLRQARAVFCLYPDDTAFLVSRGIQAFTWTYGPDVVPALFPPTSDPDIDVLHVGSVTEHRAARLEALRRAGARVCWAFKMDWLEKCHALSRTRATLALAFDASASYLPWPRIVFARSQRTRSISDIAASGAFGERWCVVPRLALPDETSWVKFATHAIHEPLQPIEEESATTFERLVASAMATSIPSSVPAPRAPDRV